MALDGDERSASRPGRYTLGERASGAHWIGGSVGPGAGLDIVEKSKISFPAVNRIPDVQSIVHRKIQVKGRRAKNETVAYKKSKYILRQSTEIHAERNIQARTVLLNG
jgi:hypothetical protein